MAKKLEGKVDQVKGRVQEAVGTVTGNRMTKLKGKVQRAKGTAKTKIG